MPSARPMNAFLIALYALCVGCASGEHRQAADSRKPQQPSDILTSTYGYIVQSQDLHAGERIEEKLQVDDVNPLL